MFIWNLLTEDNEYVITMDSVIKENLSPLIRGLISLFKFMLQNIKHKISIVSEIKKNRCIRSRNMLLSQNLANHKICKYFIDSMIILK